MNVILNIDVENRANFCHESSSTGLFIIARHVVAPVNFINFAGGGAGGGSLEVAGDRDHGYITSALVEANNHDGIGKLGTIVFAVTFVTIHVVATGAKSKDVSTAVTVGF